MKANKYIIIKYEYLVQYLTKVTRPRAADDILKQMDAVFETVDLQPGDQLVRGSDVQDGLQQATQEVAQ